MLDTCNSINVHDTGVYSCVTSVIRRGKNKHKMVTLTIMVRYGAHILDI